MEGEFTPLCSPELLARSAPLKEPADLLRLPRLTPMTSGGASGSRWPASTM